MLAGFDNIREAESYEERLLERAVTDYWYAKEFGWLPSQVDKESAIRTRAIRTVGIVLADLRSERERQHSVPQQPRQLWGPEQ